jgi:hypothetical protein
MNEIHRFFVDLLSQIIFINYFFIMILMLRIAHKMADMAKISRVSVFYYHWAGLLSIQFS